MKARLDVLIVILQYLLMRFSLVVLTVFFIFYLNQATNYEDLEISSSQEKESDRCKPFGVRLSWGRYISDPNSSQKVQIRFNTLQECQTTSLLLDKNFIIECPISPIFQFPMMFQMEKFRSYVHICSLSSQIEYGLPFSYNIFDQASSSRYMDKEISITLKDPNDTSRSVKLIQFADWGKIKYARLPDITEALKPILSQTQIDAIIINGDIAYNLNMQKNHHLQFMKLLEKISSKVPIIFNRGNHQYQETGLMFCTYFQVYGLCDRNATGLSIGSVFLALFDPQAALIPRSYHLYTREERLSSLTNLKLELEKGSKSHRIMLGFSHYPLICSFPTTAHCLPQPYYNEVLPLYVNLQEYYNTLLDFKVPLFFSGHVHTYERSHKLLRGYRFMQLALDRMNYNMKNDQYFIHVVSGVAGSDTYLNEASQYEKQPFICKISMKKVGFDVITVAQSKIRSQHIQVALGNLISTLDDFTINVVQGPNQ